MRKHYRAIPLLLLAMVFLFNQKEGLSQNDPTTDSLTWKYDLPIWGKKAAEKGYKLQLPYGVNTMYVNTIVGLDISYFKLSVGDGKNQEFIDEKLNVNTLNFTKVRAYFNGFNFRPDVWIFPFLNVYGIITTGAGQTQVELAPQIPYGDGNDILSLPSFGSTVDFRANAYGLGGTFVYGFGRNYFVSGDANYSWTVSDLLEDNVGVITASGRVGEHWNIGKRKDKKLAVYVGFMYRNFTNTNGTKGQINLSEVFPDLESNVNSGIDNRVDENTQTITDNTELIGTLNPVSDREQIADLKAENRVLNVKNAALEGVADGLDDSGVFDTEIRYEIKKSMLQNFTFEFGTSYDLSKHFAVRAEIGASKEQTLILAGLAYRFGLRR
jgi:hypothetical protein